MWPLAARPVYAPIDVSATFCDGSVVGPLAVYSNLYRNAPFDYDLGAMSGRPQIVYAPNAAQVCIPITLSSERAVTQFQFVLRCDASLLDCSATACGTWSAGSAWTASLRTEAR